MLKNVIITKPFKQSLRNLLINLTDSSTPNNWPHSSPQVYYERVYRVCQQKPDAQDFISIETFKEQV